MPRFVAIVEDDVSVAASLALVVEAVLDIQAVVVYHAESALTLFAGDRRFSALITDFGLPGLDGLQLVVRIRAMSGYEKLPVLMVTAADVPPGLPSSAPDVILSKPFSPREVARALASLLA